MGDDSSRSIVKALKNEWSLFWGAFQGEEENPAAAELPIEKLEVLSPEEAREMAKGLSARRKEINQKLESLNKELELNSAKLESLRLVGADEEEILQRIDELHDLGQSMTITMSRLDQKLRLLRDQENLEKVAW